MQLDVDAIVSRDVCLCALRVESNNRIQGAPVFFFFFYSSLLVEPFPSHSLLASKCNTRLNQTPHFFLSIDDEGRQNKKKKRRHRSILGPTPWRKKLSIRLFIFDSSSRWFFFILSLLLFYSVDFFFYLGPSIEMAVYTLERERANKRLLYYWFSLHLGHFW